MSKLGRILDWILPGLICLSPMGAIAYYDGGAEDEAPHSESKRTAPRAAISDVYMRAAVIPFARL